MPRHAEVVLFSDFLGPLDQLQQRFAHYAAAGVHGHIVQILDPAEETLPYHGRVRFEGLEGEGPWLLSRVEAVRGAYKEKLAAQRDALLSITSSCGWRMTQHRTDHPPESALMALYAGLSLPKEAF